MKRLYEVDIHKDWAMTHNLNWGLVVSDHWEFYSGPLVKFTYAGGMLPIICHPLQRFACPTKNGGYRWVPVMFLNPHDEIYFVQSFVEQHTQPIKISRIMEYDVIDVVSEKLYTLTVTDELSFIIHDLIAHRNPHGYKAEKSEELVVKDHNTIYRDKLFS